MEITCWQCGVEPLAVAEVTTIGDAEPRYIPRAWPPADHGHSERPPSPSELAAMGDATRRRIHEIAAE